MKTLPLFSRNQLYKISVGAILLGLHLPSFSQTTPLETPKNTQYPGVIETFEKLITIDSEKFSKKSDYLAKNGHVFNGTENVTNLDLDPDFLNSVILHSDPGYIRLASANKCRFYESILTDLLKTAEGKIKNVLITYVEKDARRSAVISRKDFLNKVVNTECPETQKSIQEFQVKTIQQTLSKISFEIPTGIEQCRNIHMSWLNGSSKTPFLCQIHEYIKEAKNNGGDPKDLQQRKAIAKVLEDKQSVVQREYLENLCTHLDDEDMFCEQFLNVSFWTKIAAGYENKIFAEDICRKVVNSQVVSDQQYQVCLARMKKEKDLCLYPDPRQSGMRPQPDCDLISTALNFSSYKSNFKDCAGNSDQMIITNMGRILSHYQTAPMPFMEGPCQVYSAGSTYAFNNSFDNEESWKLEACYDDKLAEREVCAKTFFGNYNNLPESYPVVVANILKKTRGIDPSMNCKMLDSQDYNPLLLEYKSGCFIIFERENCHISSCKHKILLNDREIDFIRIKNKANLAYFPLNVRDERFSQHYLLTRDFKKDGKQINNLSGMVNYFKKAKNGIIHGVACAEDLLPTFFKSYALNQCSPLPFIISGMIKDGDKAVFVVRAATDSVQAPRLVSWSSLYSGVKSYQRAHPLKLWTMYALD